VHDFCSNLLHRNTLEPAYQGLVLIPIPFLKHPVAAS